MSVWGVHQLRCLETEAESAAETMWRIKKLGDGQSPEKDFDILLTVHLSIFILVINQLDAQNLFYNKFISCLYMFRAPCAHRQYHHTSHL